MARGQQLGGYGAGTGWALLFFPICLLLLSFSCSTPWLFLLFLAHYFSVSFSLLQIWALVILDYGRDGE
jgi:hypothetical protein